ncbi:transcriptional regulator with XRE-family HTH domain [Neobacillus sp. B4I6]|uniref:helix-turn-helix domain-containing protein n=1 Tax=Neobacillus sp. B4I6 TaxID=3373925 RepID=UPI003D1E2F01
MVNIGEKLNSFRILKGISSSELEKICGVSQATISKIENNIQSPSIETLNKICDALEIPVSLLFKDFAPDMINLIETAKQLSPNQRQKITEMIGSFLEKSN